MTETATQVAIAERPAHNDLPVFVGESYEDHISAWIQAAQEINERHWMLGAIAASLEKKYSEGIIRKFAGEVVVTATTIYDHAKVYRTFENSDRSEILSWTHHKIAAYASDPVEFLREAEDEGWSVKEMLYQSQQRKQLAAVTRIEANTTCTVADLDRLVTEGHKFGTIYADPPWSYGNQGTRSATDNHYETMTLEEIAALPVAELAAEQCHLHLWTTNAFLHDSFHLFEQWGFDFKSLLVWDKDKFGIGNYWRLQTEYLLLGVKGGLTFLNHSQPNIVRGARTRHSAKPEQVRRMIEKVSPGPRLEMFARRISEGWVAWGNEIERTMFDSDVREVA